MKLEWRRIYFDKFVAAGGFNINTFVIPNFVSSTIHMYCDEKPDEIAFVFAEATALGFSQASIALQICSIELGANGGFAFYDHPIPTDLQWSLAAHPTNDTNFEIVIEGMVLR